jgi:hypothetical protein
MIGEYHRRSDKGICAGRIRGTYFFRLGNHVIWKVGAQKTLVQHGIIWRGPEASPFVRLIKFELTSLGLYIQAGTDPRIECSPIESVDKGGESRNE